MPCCSVDSAEHHQPKETRTDEPTVCGSCGGPGKPVSRKTVVSNLKAQFLEEALNGTYRFCAAAECSVVYFEQHGTRIFTVDNLRIVVGIKASRDPIPLCYCFGFDESHLREEILRTGNTTIPERIARLIHADLCACDVRNPSGACCLGEVNKAAKRLKKENALTPLQNHLDKSAAIPNLETPLL